MPALADRPHRKYPWPGFLEELDPVLGAPEEMGELGWGVGRGKGAQSCRGMKSSVCLGNKVQVGAAGTEGSSLQATVERSVGEVCGGRSPGQRHA